MKTIRALIEEKRNYDSSRREIAREERIEAVYSAHPELRQLDGKLLELRAKRLVSAIDHDNARTRLYESDEKIMASKRERYIKDNGIDPAFDQEAYLCELCKDTGFCMKNGIRIVCDCMKRELNECFDSCGLSDYSSYSNKTFDAGRFKDAKERSGRRNKIAMIINGSPKYEGTDLWVLTGAPCSGKTFLAVIMTKTAIMIGKSAAYVNCDSIYNMTEDDIGFMRSCDFLCIDDYSGSVTSGFKTASVINSVLEARNARKLKTLIVTSSSLESLVSESDARIAGKLSKAGTI